jgi:hypothetical protein
VAGHIGFELRCEERKFISLNIRQYSDSPEPAQTVLLSQENNFLCGDGSLFSPHATFVQHRTRRSGFATSEFESSDGGLTGGTKTNRIKESGIKGE